MGKLSPAGSYRAFRFPWTGRPQHAPSIAAQRAPGGVTVHASWNGATDVARWEVLAGRSSGALRPVGTSSRDGFETTLQAVTHDDHVAVQAMDASGKVLGRSRTVVV